MVMTMLATVTLSEENTDRLDKLVAELNRVAQGSGAESNQDRNAVLNSVLDEYFRRDPLEFSLDRDAR